VSEPAAILITVLAVSEGPRSTRHFGMDWLRIAAFGLLILYHIGMAFVPWPFEIKVAAPRNWVAIPMLATNAWRLSLLFLVSGYASAALLAREPVGNFFRGRMLRLGLPLIFGMAVLNTPQPWVALVTQHGYTRSFAYFLLHDYYRFQFIDDVAMPTWMHLWFVAYLIAYTSLLSLGCVAFPGRGAAITRLLERALKGPLVLLVPVIYVYLVRRLLPPGWIDTHALVNDWSAHAVYFAMFAFGLALRRSSQLMSMIRRQWRLGAVLAVTAYTGVLVVEQAWPGNTPVPEAWRPVFGLLRAMQCWTTIVALVGAADTYLDSDHPWRATLAEAVFPLYLIHQTIILVAGYWLLGSRLNPGLRFVVLVLATAAGSWLFYLVGRRIGWLRPWIGLSHRERDPRSRFRKSGEAQADQPDAIAAR